jgi:hypothetical protein
MTAAKRYGPAQEYEKKLARVMERLGVTKFDWNCDRHGCWVTFMYKGETYRFDHSVENAQKHDQQIRFGSDAFAQVVLTLEDLARMAERGIYDLQIFVAGLKLLPAPVHLPECLRILQFDRIPSAPEEIKARFLELAQTHHPDHGGDAEEFKKVVRARDEAIEYLAAPIAAGTGAQK